MAAATTFREPPPKNHCFCFNAPKDASCEDIIDAFEDVVGQGGLKILQRQGGSKFCAVVANAEAATKLSTAGEIVVNGVSTPVACLDSRIIYVTVFRLRQRIRDEDLSAALTAYGKVLAVQPPNFPVRPPQSANGTRLVRIQMQRPIPNFLSVLGCRVQCEYKGVKRVCSRCDVEGHIGRECKIPWCALCWALGHDTKNCPRHVDADCIKTRSCGAACPGPEADQPDDLTELQGRFTSCGLERRPEGVTSSSEETAVSKSSEQGVKKSLSRDLPTQDAPTPDNSSPLPGSGTRVRKARKKAGRSAAIV